MERQDLGVVRADPGSRRLSRQAGTDRCRRVPDGTPAFRIAARCSRHVGENGFINLGSASSGRPSAVGDRLHDVGRPQREQQDAGDVACVWHNARHAPVVAESHRRVRDPAHGESPHESDVDYRMDVSLPLIAEATIQLTQCLESAMVPKSARTRMARMPMLPTHLRRNEDELAIVRRIAGSDDDTPLLMLNLNSYAPEPGFPNGELHRRYDGLDVFCKQSVPEFCGDFRSLGRPSASSRSTRFWQSGIRPTGLSSTCKPRLARRENYPLRARCVAHAVIHRCPGDRPLLTQGAQV